ncbi:hypothetical protein MYCTH_2121009 [Thermothelomyces thermophilus ATCC 42464]|uniref:Rhodopsin domain-containing protein n=1 Tax=Thermothelomyces thermophilus (strain ATCC 42464 / BCRC 31852 / DSM 1799) TaxID=573729 RepID=G2QMG1_THET4|nr:uncharacterized protein MYCTH_2121009 [Thermothelomyces thermophilus ATCC 42464]AEO61141.1 hypothetical protein MYCTH_2121009 [Thermothelomyces thermophilus ATCC 42464]
MSVESFTIEAWTYLVIDIVVVAVRTLARWRQMGIRGLAPDDFLMIIAILLYTAETATAHYVGAYWHGLANSGYVSLGPLSEEYHLRVKGSQTQLFGWLVYTCLLWTLKTAWLFFFKRLGDGVGNMSLKINIGFVLVFVTFFGTFFAILFGCYPVEKHWQIYPDPGNFCYPAVSRLQAIVLITTNLTTDFYIISIPMPMVWSARISTPKKMGLCIMFCGGLITAVFGGLRCGYVLADTVDGPQQAGEWSCRESFVAVFVTNFPVIFPIVHRALRAHGGTLFGASSSGKNTGGTPGTGTKNSSGFKLTTISRRNQKRNFKHPLSLPADTVYTRFGAAGYDGKSIVPSIPEEDIKVTTEWQVHSQRMDAETAAREKRNVEMGFHAS